MYSLLIVLGRFCDVHGTTWLFNYIIYISRTSCRQMIPYSFEQNWVLGFLYVYIL